MAYAPIFAQKQSQIKAPRVDFYTEVGGTYGLYHNDVEIGSGSITSFGVVGAVPNANGASTAGHVATLQPADGTHPGVVTILAQPYAGLKTFLNGIQLGSAASNGNRILDTSGFTILSTGAQDDNTSYFLGRSAGLSTLAANLFNMGLGTFSLRFCTTGSSNTGVGFNTLPNLLTGIGCIAVGVNAGQNYTSNESRNIVIGSAGTLGESNKIHIGTVGIQDGCQIVGIYGNSPASAQAVIIDSNGNMGSQNVLTLGAIGASPNANAMTLSAGRVLNLELASASFPGLIGTGTQTIAGRKTFNDGINIPAGQAVNGSTGQPMLWQGNGQSAADIFVGFGTGTATVAPAARNVGVGRDALKLLTNTVDNTAVGYQALTGLLTGSGNVAIGSAAGSALVGGGDNNIYIKNIGVAAENAKIRIGTVGTHTAAFIAGIYGVSPASPQEVIIDSNGQLGSKASLSLGAVASSPNANGATLTGSVLNLQVADGSFPGVVSTSAQTFAGLKTFTNGVKVGAGSGVFNINSVNLVWLGAFDDENSIYVGQSSGANITTGSKNNTAVGALSLRQTTTGTENVAMGSSAGVNVTTGIRNTLLGRSACASLLTGSRNIVLGYSSGSAYVAAESDNILINQPGVVSETGAIRIGSSGSQTTCYIAGITGVTSAGAVTAVINASGQLGTIVSSQRFKNTINNVTPEKLAALLQLRVVSFYMNDDVNKEFINYGCIAEEVEPILPELIRYEPVKEMVEELEGEELVQKERVVMDDKQKVQTNKQVPQTIDYASLWPLLLAQVQVLTQQVASLQTQVAALTGI